MAKRKKTKADEDAFLSSAGGWKGLIDADKFLKDIEESRKVPRPKVDRFEPVAGVVHPATRTEDFEQISREAKEEHVAKTTAKLNRQPK
jgi:hypothetical protein